MPLLLSLADPGMGGVPQHFVLTHTPGLSCCHYYPNHSCSTPAKAAGRLFGCKQQQQVRFPSLCLLLGWLRGEHPGHWAGRRKPPTTAAATVPSWNGVRVAPKPPCLWVKSGRQELRNMGGEETCPEHRGEGLGIAILTWFGDLKKPHLWLLLLLCHPKRECDCITAPAPFPRSAPSYMMVKYGFWSKYSF